MTPAIEIRPCRQIQINGYCYHPSLPLSTDHGAREEDSHKPKPFRVGKWMRRWKRQRRAHILSIIRAGRKAALLTFSLFAL